jgi:AraC-like DNA-binding protein
MPSIDPEAAEDDSLLRFSTGDPDAFVESMSSIATGLGCSPVRPKAMNTEILGARLPDLGIFASTLTNFRVQSAVRPYYGVTIPLEGHSKFLVGSSFVECNSTRAHLQHPDKPFDAMMGDSTFRGLQLCFDQIALDSFASKLQGPTGTAISMLEILDMTKPEAQSFARHAAFIWSEILRGGAVRTSKLVARESSNLLATLLVSAAIPSETPCRKFAPNAGRSGLRRAEEYLAEHLSEPISIADVAEIAGMSARNLSREFRRHRGTTIKEFIKARRLEAANRTLLAAEPKSTNVTQVALDLGFEQLGRFSGDYKKTFGEKPSETLTR